jgi:hypothetical protein
MSMYYHVVLRGISLDKPVVTSVVVSDQGCEHEVQQQS